MLVFFAPKNKYKSIFKCVLNIDFAVFKTSTYEPLCIQLRQALTKNGATSCTKIKQKLSEK